MAVMDVPAGISRWSAAAPEDAVGLAELHAEFETLYREYGERVRKVVGRGRVDDAEAVVAETWAKRDRLQRAAMEGRLVARKVGTGKRMPWLVTAE